MATPRIIDRVTLPGPALFRPLKEFHLMACGIGGRAVTDKGSIAPLWIVAAGHEMIFIETPWEFEWEKDFAASMLRELLHQLHADAYSFVCEIWSAQNSDNMPAALKDLPPSERPDRQDLLYIDTRHRDGRQHVSTYPVTYAANGASAQLGPRRSLEKEGIGFSFGRMANLFEQASH